MCRTSLAIFPRESLGESPEKSMLRVVSTSPFSFITMTGMVLFVSSILSTRFRSVFSSALLSACMASAQMPILSLVSLSRLFTRKWEYTSDTPAIITAAAIRIYFISLVLLVQLIPYITCCPCIYCSGVQRVVCGGVQECP